MNEVASAGACLTVIVSSEVRRVSLVREDAVITGAAAAAADLYRSTFAVPCDCEQMRLCESPSYTVYLYIENMIYVPEVLLIYDNDIGESECSRNFLRMVHVQLSVSPLHLQVRALRGARVFSVFKFGG